MPHSDPVAAKAYRFAYNRRPEVKERRKQRLSRPEELEKRRVRWLAWSRTPEGLKKVKAHQKRWYAKHIVEIKRKQKRIYATDEYRAYERARRKRRTEYARRYDAKQRGESSYRIRKNLSRRLHFLVRGQVATMTLLGCTVAELKLHIQSKFRPGMAWNNYGKGGWHIDHIKPCASFDLTQPDQQRLCFHYTNLQPLWESENCSKKNRDKPNFFVDRSKM